MTKSEILKNFADGEFQIATPEIIETLLNSNLGNHQVIIATQTKRDGQSWKTVGSEELKSYSYSYFASGLYNFAFNTLNESDAFCSILFDIEDCVPASNWEGRGFYTNNSNENEFLLSTEQNQINFFNHDVYSHRVAIKVV